MVFKTYGNEVGFLIAMIVTFALIIISIVVYTLVIKFPPKATTIPDQSSLIFTGNGMVCNSLLQCPNNLTCIGANEKTGKSGMCYADIGQECQTIFDCISSATLCDKICIAQSNPGSLGTRCNPLISSTVTNPNQGGCSSGLECGLSYSNDYRCLIPLGDTGCGNTNELCALDPTSNTGVKCQNNTCVTAIQHGKACATTQQCGGFDICVGGKCEPSAGIIAGELGSYCSPYPEMGLDACLNLGSGVVCGISNSFYLPDGIGYCAAENSINTEKCTTSIGCSPFFYCGSDSKCHPPSDPNSCTFDVSNGGCILPYVCSTGSTPNEERRCIGGRGAMCSVGSECISGVCSQLKITKITVDTLTSATSPSFEEISGIDIPNNLLNAGLSGITLINGGSAINKFVVYSPTALHNFYYYPSESGDTLIYTVLVQSAGGITINSFTLLSVSLIEGGNISKFLILVNVNTNVGVYDSLYLVNVDEGNTNIVLSAVPILTYYSVPTASISLPWSDPYDNFKVYALLTSTSQGNVQFLVSVDLSNGIMTNVIDPSGGVPITDSSISYYNKYVSNNGISPGNFFRIVGNIIQFSGDFVYFYTLLDVPSAIAYQYSNVNPINNFYLFYTNANGGVYYFNIFNGVVTQYKLPGYAINFGMSQSTFSQKEFFVLSSVCN